MIRRLTEADREPLMALLGKEPALNLFIIGDVENFGFQQDFMDVWGEIDAADGRIRAVLLRYYNSYLPFADGAFDVKGFTDKLLEKKFDMLSGTSEIVDAFAKEITFRKEKRMIFAELKEMKGKKEIKEKQGRASSATHIIKKATVNEVELICSLTDMIEEFEDSPEAARFGLHKTLESRTGRTYYIEQEGRVIATASTGGENSMSAMIIGVGTHPEFRGQGLAARLVEKLCADLLAEGKTLCLFYDNPLAATIYKRLGFQDIGSWSMAFI